MGFNSLILKPCQARYISIANQFALGSRFDFSFFLSLSWRDFNWQCILMDEYFFHSFFLLLKPHLARNCDEIRRRPTEESHVPSERVSCATLLITRQIFNYGERCNNGPGENSCHIRRVCYTEKFQFFQHRQDKFWIQKVGILYLYFTKLGLGKWKLLPKWQEK